jgi:hypothetical protein
VGILTAAVLAPPAAVVAAPPLAAVVAVPAAVVALVALLLDLLELSLPHAAPTNARPQSTTLAWTYLAFLIDSPPSRSVPREQRSSLGTR